MFIGAASVSQTAPPLDAPRPINLHTHIALSQKKIPTKQTRVDDQHHAAKKKPNTRTHSLANDSKSSKKGGQREFNGLVDVYRKTLASDGIAGLYRGFVSGSFLRLGFFFLLPPSAQRALLPTLSRSPQNQNKKTKPKKQSISCVGIIVYRGLYFGMYDSIKPVLLTGDLADNFLAAFLLGWGIT